MLPAPAGYVITANGFTFPVGTNTTIHSKFVPDAANRTIVSTTLTITVESIIAEGAGQDASLIAIRTALERQGGELIITGLGFGTLEINTANGRKDLNWGPRPTILNWKNVGASRAAKITWQCEVSVIGCLNAPDSGQVMQATHSISFATDHGGYSTRVYNGSFTIPATRNGVNNPAIPDTADAYFERFIPEPLPGFRRSPIQRQLDRAKTTVEWTVTDTELPGNPLPDGCVDASASHTLSSQGQYATVRWNGTLEARYELERGRPRSDAWPIFIKLFTDRIQEERRRNATCIPTLITLSEPELYGRMSAAFTLNYSLAFTAPKGIDQVFPTVGIWRPAPDADWNRWSASLTGGSRSARGLAGFRHSASDDAIIDLCLGQGSALRSGGAATSTLRNGPADTPWEEIKRAMGVEDKPPPAATWIGYQCRVAVEERSRLHTHFPLPTGPDPNAGLSTLRTPGSGEFPHTDPGFQFKAQESPPPVVQYGGSPGYYVRLIGMAYRYAYEVPRPNFHAIAGAPLVDANNPELGTYWESALVGYTTHPLYAARWNLRYFVPRTAGATSALLPLAAHPFQLASLISPGG